MSKINKIKGRQVFDSRGNPTVETEVFLEDGSHASAIVPSGASKGSHEAFELRDLDDKKYLGKSVFKALEKVNGEISKALIGFSSNEQEKIDKTLKVFSSGQGKSDQIIQGQKKLDVAQKKITEALKDLRRKANVNISRTNDILKKMKK